MGSETMPQPPEGALLKAAQKKSGRPIREVAAAAGMSDARWRQIVNGFMHVQAGTVPTVAPAHTLARMARVVGVTADQLREVGREDAAEALESLVAGAGVTVAAQPPAERRLPDEIEMIYASQSLTVHQKLEAIRMVLHLRAQAEAAEVTATAFNATAVTTDQAAASGN